MDAIGCRLMRLQMHGTGTSLGDPIEINGALSVLMPRRSPAQPLALAASKAAAGHAEPAAGIVGLAFAISSLEPCALPQLLHLRCAVCMTMLKAFHMAFA